MPHMHGDRQRRGMPGRQRGRNRKGKIERGERGSGGMWAFTQMLAEVRSDSYK
jgi:hypothetical protein